MQWREEYALGIDEIDTQHRSLVEGLTCIEDAFLAGHGWVDLHAAINDLHERTYVHFSVEECLMRLFGYPHFAEHQRQHRTFLDSLKNIELHTLLQDTDNGNQVEIWRKELVGHIDIDDRALTHYILANTGGRALCA